MSVSGLNAKGKQYRAGLIKSAETWKEKLSRA